MTKPTPAGLDSGRAWLVDLAAFLGCFVVFGVAYSFGAFLKPMSNEFGVSHAVTSALFSFMTLLSFVLGPLTGDWADRHGPRVIVALGGVLLLAGLVGAAHASDFRLAFACFGIGAGGGLACVFVPGLAAVGEWFKKYRDIALGISISGIGCGTLAAAPLAATLISRVGWRQTLADFGVAGGILLMASSLLIARSPIPVERADGKAVLIKVRSPKFSLLYVSVVLIAIPIYIAMVYLPAYAAAYGVGPVAAAALVGYIGGASVLARIGLQLVAERFGLPAVYQLSFAFVCGASILWLTTHSHPGLIAFAILLGIGYGGIAALTPAIAISMFGISGLGEVLGFLLTAYGIASVVGPPLAGFLVDRSGHYESAVWYGILASVAGLATVFFLERSSRASAAVAD